MKISIKRTTPTVKFKDLELGQMFLLDELLLVKVHWSSSHAGMPVRNSIAIGGNKGVDVPQDAGVVVVTSIQAEV